ncbi:MAG: AAA family ATPase [Chloroflexota bacterium]
MMMRVPYIAGRWVRGRDHYGRRRPINHLLNVDAPAIWIVGTRRMGKTSLLRQIELETDRLDSDMVPLFWDLQGCESFDDLSYELFLALEDVADRFHALGVDVESMENKDAVAILRRLNRALSERNKRLIVLIDEAETLINIGRQDPKWVGRLRAGFNDNRQRTVVTSTKLLSLLNDTSESKDMPFLYGFSMVNLWSLDPGASMALVRQTQNQYSVNVDDLLMEQILTNTNRHPYLLQYLCQRLFVADSECSGYLRPIEEHDLKANHLLSGFFDIDFQHLTQLERRIMLAVGSMTVATDHDLIQAMAPESPDRIRLFAYGLDKLGYLRKTFGQWALGNEYLRGWLEGNFDRLSQGGKALLDDNNIEILLQIGRQNELTYLHQEVLRLQTRLRTLLTQQVNGNANDMRTVNREIHQLQNALKMVKQEISLIPPEESSLTHSIPEK